MYCRRCARDCPPDEWRKGKAIDVDGEERVTWHHEPRYRLCGWRTAVTKRSRMLAR